LQEHPGRPLEPQQVDNIRHGQPAGQMQDREVPAHRDAGPPPQSRGQQPQQRAQNPQPQQQHDDDRGKGKDNKDNKDKDKPKN
jgi:hypothetical protein